MVLVPNDEWNLTNDHLNHLKFLTQTFFGKPFVGSGANCITQNDTKHFVSTHTGICVIFPSSRVFDWLFTTSRSRAYYLMNLSRKYITCSEFFTKGV